MIQSLLRPLSQKRFGLALGLWGEAGIGKSYCIDQALLSLPYKSLRLHATSNLADLPAALAETKKLPLWTEETLKRLSLGESLDSAAASAALASKLSLLAPFVLCLEDIHEASSERLELIQKLAEMIKQKKGVGIVISSRNKPPDVFKSLRQEPLDQAGSADLLKAEFKTGLPQEALTWIYSKAAGNPLYTLEYLRFLSRQGYLWSDGKSWHWRKPGNEAIPSTVEALIEGLIEQAKGAPLVTYLLESKAILPRFTPDEVWISVARVNQQDLNDAIHELNRYGIFKDRDFAHPLFKEVAQKTLSLTRKRYLAQRAINALSNDPQQAALFIDDAKLEPSQALALLERAANQTKALMDEARTARFQVQMMSYLEGDAQAKMAFEAALNFYEYDLSEAIRLLYLAYERQNSNLDIFERLSSYLAQAGRKTEVEQLLETLPASEHSNARGLRIRIGVAHFLQEPARVISIWESHPELHTLASATTVRNVAFSKADLGDTPAALELASTALNQAHLSLEEKAILLEACGFACYTQSNFSAAVAYYTEAIELFRKHAQSHRTGSLLFNRAIALQSLARLSECLSDAETALQLAADGGHARFYANAQLVLAATRLELGEYELAEALFLEAETYYRQTGLSGWQIDASLGFSELYINWKTPYSGILARKHAFKALELARGLNNPRYVAAVMPHAVMAEALFGDAQRALELAYEGCSLSDDQGDRVIFARNIRAKAMAHKALGHIPEAHSNFQIALDIMQEMAVSLDAAKLRLDIAYLNHDLKTAKELVEWFKERGLNNGVYLCNYYFPELAKSRSTHIPDDKLSLNLLGPVQFYKETSYSVRGRKRQELLALLFEARLAGKSEISRLDLLDSLYPNEDERKASSSLKSLVYALRESFGEHIIMTTHQGYMLNACRSDVEDFLEKADTSLWRGVYLEGLELNRDSSVSDSLYTLLHDKAEDLLSGNLLEAARLSRILLEAEPYNLDYLKTHLRALRLSKQHGKLNRYYNEAKQRFLELGEVLPETWQDFTN